MINLMQLLQMAPMINQFRQNPMQFLMNQGINIPQEYMNSPESAAKYLMQNSNMNQQQINQIMNLAGQYQQQIGQNSQPPVNQPQNQGFGWPFGRR